MSWLIVALVPALLMLATFGLSRLETRLIPDTVTASDVAQFLLQAEAVDVRTLARAGMPEALNHMQRRQTERILDAAAPKSVARHQDDPFVRVALAPSDQHSRANPQFTTTRRINPV